MVDFSFNVSPVQYPRYFESLHDRPVPGVPGVHCTGMTVMRDVLGEEVYNLYLALVVSNRI